MPVLPLDDDEAVSPALDLDVIAVDQALTRLSALYPDQGRLVELRYFGGLTIEETGAVMDVSPASVKRQWVLARAWLHREMNPERQP
jgi:DNA-directed RNA polymerase specialized sigma24 family protein